MTCARLQFAGTEKTCSVGRKRHRALIGLTTEFGPRPSGERHANLRRINSQADALCTLYAFQLMCATQRGESVTLEIPDRPHTQPRLSDTAGRYATRRTAQHHATPTIHDTHHTWYRIPAEPREIAILGSTR